MPPNGVEIHRRIQSAQARLIELHAGLQDFLLAAPEDDAHIDELLSLHARDDADHRVVIRAMSVHAVPPREMRAASAAGGKGAPRMPRVRARAMRMTCRFRARRRARAPRFRE